MIKIVRYVLRAAAATTFSLGIILLIFSEVLAELVGDGTNNNDNFAVYLGTALLGFAITNWLYSNVENLKDVLPAIYGNIVSLCLAIVIDVFSIVDGKATTLVWLILLMHVIFAAAFIYCLAVIRRQLKY